MRKGGRKEKGRKGGREGGREDGRMGGREEGRKGGRKEGRKGGREEGGKGDEGGERTNLNLLNQALVLMRTKRSYNSFFSGTCRPPDSVEIVDGV
jgi:hypothetical protein